MRLLSGTLLSVLVFTGVASAGDSSENTLVYRWMGAKTVDRAVSPGLESRFPAPEGYKRVDASPFSFAHWLRNIPLKPEGSDVLFFDGTTKPDQSAVAAVVDIDVGKRDRQQCADAVMRLWAEYLYGIRKAHRVCFNASAGEKMCWSAYRKKLSFRRYLSNVFAFANSRTLFHQMKPVIDAVSVQPGHVFIQPASKGAYGHAVMVMDVARNAKGDVVVLLAQSYMPAQSVHVLKNTGQPSLGAWFRITSGENFVTPDWTFPKNHLRRFPG